MEDEIIAKLNEFFKKHLPMREQCEIVYFMVELRKLLDWRNNRGGKEYRVLRFYCDWSVHTSKKRLTPEIKKVMEEIDKSITGNKDSPYDDLPIHFVYKEDLKDEIEGFLKELGLSNKILEENNWYGFVHLLNKVLIDQPIIKPTEHIEYFTFKPIKTKEGATWVVKFNDHRGIQGFANELIRS